jgi:hypothetical protein
LLIQKLKTEPPSETKGHTKIKISLNDKLPANFFGFKKLVQEQITLLKRKRTLSLPKLNKKDSMRIEK